MAGARIAKWGDPVLWLDEPIRPSHLPAFLRPIACEGRGRFTVEEFAQSVLK